MATVNSNKALNTGTVNDNKDFTQKDLTWDEANFTWDEAQGTWDNPENMNNKTLNSATVNSNKALN